MAQPEFTAYFEDLARHYSSGDMELVRDFFVERLVIYNAASNVVFVDGPEAVCDLLMSRKKDLLDIGVVQLRLSDIDPIEIRENRAVIDVTWQRLTEKTEKHSKQRVKYFLVKRKDGWKISMAQRLFAVNQMGDHPYLDR